MRILEVIISYKYNTMVSDELSKPEDTLRKIIRAFFSDLHIVIIELILKESYITEYSFNYVG